jgi:glycosyltransferase involved in cell wall biosynthesis
VRLNVLKVLQLIPTLDRSGAEKQMVMLAKGLPRDRFHVEVATLTRLGAFESELSAAGIPVTSIGKRFKLDLLALVRLTRFLRARKFDVVHTWIFAANTYGRVAARLAQVPVVIVAEMAVDLWKGRSERFIDQRLSTWCDCLVGNSHAVVDFYRKLGVPDDRLAMIYSGSADESHAVDSRAVRTELGLTPEAPLVLFAGRLAEQKRVDDLIKAIDLLQHVEPDLRTVIIGEGPLRDHLEETARAYDLDGRLLFLGYRDDVPRLMAAANVVVLPSAYEGLPNVVLEAMRLCKPVVATAAPGTTEAVVDRETGLLVPVGNVMLLARAIRDVVRDPILAKRLGEAGQARVDTHFRVDTMIAQFIQLYEDLARAKGLSIS